MHKTRTNELLSEDTRERIVQAEVHSNEGCSLGTAKAPRFSHGASSLSQTVVNQRVWIVCVWIAMQKND